LVRERSRVRFPPRAPGFCVIRRFFDLELKNGKREI
jgi:hypothetical protein